MWREGEVCGGARLYYSEHGQHTHFLIMSPLTGSGSGQIRTRLPSLSLEIVKTALPLLWCLTRQLPSLSRNQRKFPRSLRPIIPFPVAVLLFVVLMTRGEGRGGEPIPNDKDWPPLGTWVMACSLPCHVKYSTLLCKLYIVELRRWNVIMPRLILTSHDHQ